MQQRKVCYCGCLARGAGKGHTSMRSKRSSRGWTAQGLGMPITNHALLLRSPAGHCSIEGRCGQHEMHKCSCRALRHLAVLSRSSSRLRRKVKAVPCTWTHASSSQAWHNSYGNVERLLERDWMLQRPDTIVCISCSGDLLHPL